MRIKKVLFVALGVLILIAALVGIVVYHFFFSMSNLPEGTFIKESASPSNEYVIKLYLVDGGATVSTAIRGELVTSTGEKRNIYWEYRVDTASIEWKDDHTVVINGHSLNLLNNDVYDWRRQ